MIMGPYKFNFLKMLNVFFYFDLKNDIICEHKYDSKMFDIQKYILRATYIICSILMQWLFIENTLQYMRHYIKFQLNASGYHQGGYRLKDS